MRKVLGECLNKNPVNVETVNTDLPEPVVPAMSKCGILRKSTIRGSPLVCFPKAIGSFTSSDQNFSSANKSFK